MNEYPGIRIEGQILSSEILEKLGQEGTKYQKPKDFGFKPKGSLRDEIQFAYSLARQQWEIFKRKKSRWDESERGTSDTRNYWMLPLFDSLGYQLDNARAEHISNRSYAVSHRDFEHGGFPVHIMSIRDKMDQKRNYGGPRLSPHGLLQEYLNVTEHLYGLVSNGLKLRVLRDSTRLSRLSYVEFDLEAMMEDELYTDFAVMFRLIHASRMPVKPEESPESIMEAYHQDAIEAGARIREKLREKVEISLKELGNGFLSHPGNHELRQLFMDDKIDATKYYRMLLKIIYRLLFLMVSEERNMIYPGTGGEEWNEELLRDYRSIYHNYYSIHRLRTLAEKKHQLNTDEEDLWESLKRTFLLFEKEALGERLGIQALNGELFSPSALEPLIDCRLTNRVLLESLDAIARFENEDGQLTRVNYGGLDVEEFGSVYEALLDYEPRVQGGTYSDQIQGWSFRFAEGTERKSTGSYYTRTELVQELIKSALVPVIEERLKEAGTKKERVQALRDLKVCDPAVGSGHFLLAAARKIAEYMARVRAGEEQPPPDAYRKALREVIQHCIYGVDMNPMAVELCKVALWLESHSVGFPLTFLDHHIKCGNSLIGLDDLKRLDRGIPDGAFKEVIGDDKEIARKLKKRNHEERKAGKQTEWQAMAGAGIQALEGFAERLHEIDCMPERSVEDIQRKAKVYVRFKQEQSYRDTLHAANVWTGAFFIEKTSWTVEQNLVPTTRRLHSYIANPRGADARFIGTMEALSQEHRFFHWPLEFPEVHMQDGFDVVLGNPPWERIKLEEKEFFTGKDENIANARNKAQRTKLIKELKDDNIELYKKYEKAKHYAEALSNFVRESDRYPLTAKGDINTYQLFSGLDRALIRVDGRAGFIVPTGIATDYYNEDFFRDIVEKKSILSLFDFENSKGLFEGVHRSYKFCLLTLGSAAYQNVEQLEAEFAFFLTHPNQLDDEFRRFTLTPEDLARINPNTMTTPTFRTQPDAELTRKIYLNTPILIKYQYDGKGKKTDEVNPWGIKFTTTFHMSNDSNLFFEEAELRQMGFSLQGNRFVKGDEIYLPLFEGKSVGDYDHRFASIIINPENVSRKAYQEETSLNDHQMADFVTKPEYWVPEKEVNSKINGHYNFRWSLVYKRTVTASSEKTLRTSIIPHFSAGDKIPLIFTNNVNSPYTTLLMANFNSMITDLITKFKTGYVNLGQFVLEQLPIIPPSEYSKVAQEFIISRVFELVYTSWDIKAFADNLWNVADDEVRTYLQKQWENNKEITGGHEWMLPNWKDAFPEIEWEQEKGCPMPPFKWDEDRRLELKAELDAYYARLYGLDEEELLYILDPEEVYGEDFPGETFRVLKNKEMRKYGEYRTRNLVMEAWKRLEEGRLMMSESKLRLVKSAKEASKEVLEARRDHKMIRLDLQSPYDTQRGIMMKAVDLHEEAKEDAEPMGRTKLEKVTEVVEKDTGTDCNRTPYRMNYGPLDLETLKKVEHRALMTRCITRTETEQGYKYFKGTAFDFQLYEFNQYLDINYPGKREEIERIINLFVPLTREKSEVIATVYAAWNDLLLEGKIPDEEMIVTEARENWHPDKLKIERKKFFEAIEWLIENKLVPKGVGKHTLKKSSQSEFVHSIQKDVDMKEFGLHEGIYSITDAATITQLSYDKVRRWFRELMEAQYEGLTGAEKKDLDKLRISFHGVIELVVIGTLRDNGFTLKKILKAREDLANKTRKKYPFATNNVRDRLKVAGKPIIFELPNGDMVTLDGTGQYNLEIIRQFFRDIEFNTEGVATRILPTKGSKLIVIDPKEGGGKPVIKGKGVWVESIVKAYSGPESKDVLIDQYNLEEKEIQAALDYSDSYQN